jgi:hypothetical protein
MQKCDPDKPDNIVLEELQSGFILNGPFCGRPSSRHKTTQSAGTSAEENRRRK